SLHPLASLDAWTSAGDATREAAVATILAALPYASRASRAGALRLATVEEGKLTWLVVPGGVYRRGIPPVEARHMEEKLGIREGQTGASFYRPWFEAVLAAASPVEVVQVRPFLAATRPLAQRARGDRAWVEEIAERVPIAELWGRP